MNLSSLWKSEDWWACWLGFLLFIMAFTGAISTVPRPREWSANPLNAFSPDMVLSMTILIIGLTAICYVGTKIMEGTSISFVPAFTIFSLLSVLAMLLAKQIHLGSYGLEYVLWALAIGIIIGNVTSVPKWLKKASKPELYIKTGLVLLGGEILFSVILNLGVRGLLVAWGVTPIVFGFIYFYGTRKLKMKRTLSVLIAAATSVCGVSAAIAVAAATRAKKEYLTLTISMSLIATVLMLVGLPAVIKALEIDYTIGGAWIGGTIDSTGAVVAAGELLGQEAVEVAAVVKLIQNLLIGFLAFALAIIWVTRVEKESSETKPSLREIWLRFPKFIIGFVFLSLMTSLVLIPTIGEGHVSSSLTVSKDLRSYLFALAFVSIGIETNFKELRKHVKGGKPIILYCFGQIFNIAFTFLIVWLLFSILHV